ncbi:MAG TPA: hypothetical protein VHO72_09600 [Bacteroidales bacterium]|nr:hypothetical protein [Bacteroidales bacterium]
MRLKREFRARLLFNFSFYIQNYAKQRPKKLSHLAKEHYYFILVFAKFSLSFFGLPPGWPGIILSRFLLFIVLWPIVICRPAEGATQAATCQRATPAEANRRAKIIAGKLFNITSSYMPNRGKAEAVVI